MSAADYNDSKKTSIKTQQWNSVVTIALVEGRNLVAMDDNGLSDPYVKFKLGTERYKTKVDNIFFIAALNYDSVQSDELIFVSNYLVVKKQWRTVGTQQHVVPVFSHSISTLFVLYQL